MKTLKIMLDTHLSQCRMYANSCAFVRTYFDQSFGMATMYRALYPEEAQAVDKLWEEVYRPQYEELMWG